MRRRWASLPLSPPYKLSACRGGGNSLAKILIPARLGALILSAPGSMSLRHLEWRCDNGQGRRADNARRGWSAGRRSPDIPGRAPSHGAQAARSQGRPKGASQAPGASRRSIPPLFGGTPQTPGGKEKGNGLPGAGQRIRAMTHARFIPPLKGEGGCERQRAAGWGLLSALQQPGPTRRAPKRAAPSPASGVGKRRRGARSAARLRARRRKGSIPPAKPEC
jgi:hypothetical protein